MRIGTGAAPERKGAKIHNRSLNDQKLEQAVGGAGSSSLRIRFEFQATAEDNAESIREKIYLANPDLTENQADEVLGKAEKWMQMGWFGTDMARILNGDVTVNCRV